MSINGLIPYLYYQDADAALDWMEQVLGFTDPVRWRDESGRVSEADIFAGSAMLSISGGTPPDESGQGALLIIKVDDVDAQYRRISEATDVSADPPADQPYGPRTFTVSDPWGYRWTFWQGEAIPPS